MVGIRRILASICAGLLLCGCAGMKHVRMGEYAWVISDHWGWAVSSDSTYQMSFGNTLVDKEMRIIGQTDSLVANAEMYRYVQELLKLSRLADAKVLFFAPGGDVLFVELPAGYKQPKPNSISTKMLEPNPWTGWIWDEDEEAWNRKSDEMYTNIYTDKKRKLLVVVDCFDYGDTPIARIQRIQTSTKKFRKRFPNGEVGSTCADMTRPEHWEAVSNWIDSHRRVSFENYRIGQELKNKK